MFPAPIPPTFVPHGDTDAVTARATELALNLASWAVVRTRQSKASMISTKSNAADYVTDIDLSVEQWVRSSVLSAFPTHGFIGEEFGHTDPAPYTWYCDPIDGTTNFSTGLPWHSFSLAMCGPDGPVVGVVADPATGEVFHAVRGCGAFLNGKPIRVSRKSGLDGSVVLTEWLACTPWDGMFQTLEELGSRYVTCRIMGSSTLSVTGLAAGRGQATIIGLFGPIDLLAAVLICKEAGLDLRDDQGEATMFPKSGGLLVANPGIADEVFSIWRRGVAAAQRG